MWSVLCQILSCGSRIIDNSVLCMFALTNVLFRPPNQWYSNPQPKWVALCCNICTHTNYLFGWPSIFIKKRYFSHVIHCDKCSTCSLRNWIFLTNIIVLFDLDFECFKFEIKKLKCCFLISLLFCKLKTVTIPSMSCQMYTHIR